MVVGVYRFINKKNYIKFRTIDTNMVEDYTGVREAFEYVESQLARRAKEVGGIDILAQQAASSFLRMLSEGESQKDCRGEPWRPKDIREVSERAELSGHNFKKVFSYA